MCVDAALTLAAAVFSMIDGINTTRLVQAQDQPLTWCTTGTPGQKRAFHDRLLHQAGGLLLLIAERKLNCWRWLPWCVCLPFKT
jgi:hypothetical protein